MNMVNAKSEARKYGKHEARNSKYETNLNDKNPKLKKFWSFGHLNFDIVSDFDIRISSLCDNFLYHITVTTRTDA